MARGDRLAGPGLEEPVAWADRLFKPRPGEAVSARHGFGILFDDLVAALCTLFVSALAVVLWRGL